MNAFDRARTTLAELLVDAGVPGVTLDPAALVPFVLVDLVTVTEAQGVGGWRCSVPVKLVAAPPGNADAAAWLGDRLEAVLRAAGFAPAAPGTYPAGGKDCPSYTLTYPLNITNPDC